MVNVVALMVTNNLFTVLGTAFATARLYVRGYLLKSLQADDWFLVLALALGIGGYGIVAWMAMGPLARRENDDISRVNQNSPYYYLWAALNEAGAAVYTLQNMFSRLSLLYSYRRFCPRESMRLQRRCVNSVVVIVVCFGLGFTYAELFPCYPPHLMYYPDRWQFESKRKWWCLAPRQFFYWSAVFGVVMDGMVYFLPFWLVSKANLSRQQLLGLYSLFAFGFIVLGLSVARIPFLRILKWTPLYNGDLYSMMNVWILTLAEANCIMVAASLPTLRPLVRQVKRALKNRREAARLHSSAGVTNNHRNKYGCSGTGGTERTLASSNATVDGEKIAANLNAKVKGVNGGSESVFDSRGGLSPTPGPGRPEASDSIPLRDLTNPQLPQRNGNATWLDNMDRVSEEDEQKAEHSQKMDASTRV